MEIAQRFSQVNESVIREMTRLAVQHEAINLSQGFPDYPPPKAMVDAAVEAMRSGLNQYSFTWGYTPLRRKLAEVYSERLGWEVDPDEHVVVTCGTTEAIVAAMMTVLNPGEQIIIIEPAHEMYRPAAVFSGAEPVAVALEAPDYRLDPERLAAAVTPRTRAVLLNTPHNPTGRVFDDEEMAGLIRVVLKNDLVVITDEIYDRILYDGRRHICPGSMEALRERTITLGGFGKTYAVTGWRLGYGIAPSHLAAGLRPAHDFLTICAPTPLQAAAVAALNLPASYYERMTEEYHERRDLMMSILDEVGFVANRPEGAYYTMADYSHLPIPQAEWDSVRFARWLTTEIGVAVVPGVTFYGLPGYGHNTVRFAFPKRLETLREAGRRLARLRQ
ncbi:MAG: pyridoxal phosphate-dependent aminotransferase [Caldilineae bacterium]|nr:MAG: pyridoxal phosphate-dependent aminotransferase [Caldilineae bacterium]